MADSAPHYLKGLFCASVFNKNSLKTAALNDKIINYKNSKRRFQPHGAISCVPQLIKTLISYENKKYCNNDAVYGSGHGTCDICRRVFAQAGQI